MRIRAYIVAALLATAAAPAWAITWQEANKQSVDLMEAGRLIEAKDLAAQAADLYEKTAANYKAESHADLLLNMVDLTYRSEGIRAAVGASRTTIAALERKGAEPALTVPFWKEMAVGLENLGELEEAGSTYMRVNNMTRDAFGAQSAEHVVSLLETAFFARKNKSEVQGRRYVERAQEAVAGLPGDHVLRLVVDRGTAKMDMEQRNFAAAEKTYLGLVDKLKGSADKDRQELLKVVYQELAELYGKQGNAAKADAMVVAAKAVR